MRWILLLLPLVGCELFENNITRTVGHCDFRQAIMEPGPMCQEWRGLISQPVYPTAEGVCGTFGINFEADMTCPDESSIVGGCFMGKLGDGSGSYQWYYSSAEAPLSADEVRDNECDETGDFVAFFAYDAASSDWGPPGQ